MGHLLSSAIKMQSSAIALPSTIIVQINGPGDYPYESWMYANATLYKNFSSAGTATLNDFIVNTTINSGQQMQVLAETNIVDLSFIYINFFINGTFINSWSDFYNTGTPDLFASGSANTYVFDCGIEAP